MFRLLAIVVAAVLLVAAAGSSAAASPSDYQVLGYYPVNWTGDLTAYQSLSRARAVDSAAAFLYTLDGQGNLQAQADSVLQPLAARQGIHVYAVVNNLGQSGFDRAVATRILTDPAAKRNALTSILELAMSGDYSGIQINFENVAPRHRQDLTRFMSLLAAELHPRGYRLGIAVPAQVEDDPAHGWSGAYDYRALGRIVDHLVIMTYDQHWAGGPPGPVAAIDWVASVVRHTLQLVPADRVLLGIAAYGYDWPVGGGRGQAITGRHAPRLAAQHGVPVRWDERAQVPYFRYQVGGRDRIVYFENARSLAAKLRLVTAHGLAGVAIWRLGHEDPAIWPLISDRLGDRTPVTAARPAPATPVAHRVRPGDTLWRLGRRYGVPWGEIARGNGLAVPYTLHVGQELRLPRLHRVAAGDTLWRLGRTHRVTWTEIVRANPGVTADRLRIGQLLVIPVVPSLAGSDHVVRRGDTLWNLGRRYGLNWMEIARANGLANPHQLVPGARLIIPVPQTAGG
jgi:spore germination protein YaaH